MKPGTVNQIRAAGGNHFPSEKVEGHFDVRQFSTIDYTDAADLGSKLTARISATIGDGPRRE